MDNGIKKMTSIGIAPLIMGKVAPTEWPKIEGEYAYCDISFAKLQEICDNEEYKKMGGWPCPVRGIHREIRKFVLKQDYNIPIIAETIEKLRKEATAWNKTLKLQPAKAKKVRWTDSGAHISMARIYNGQTTFFKQRKKVKVPNKNMCLLITTALHGESPVSDYYKIGLWAYQRAVLAARQNITTTILLCDPCYSADSHNNNWFFLTTPIIKGRKTFNPDAFALAALPIGLCGYWGFSGEALNERYGSGLIGRSSHISTFLDEFPAVRKRIEKKYGEIEIVDSEYGMIRDREQMENKLRLGEYT